MRMRKGLRSKVSVEVLLGKVLCRHLRNPRSPLQMSPPPLSRAVAGEGPPGGYLPSASNGHCPSSRDQAAIQRNGDGCGGLDKGE